MSVDFAFRLIGMVAFAVGGVYLGTVLGKSAGEQPVLWASVFGLVGALMGLVVTPSSNVTLTLIDMHSSGAWFYSIPITATSSTTAHATSIRLLIGGWRIYLPIVLKDH